MANVVGAHLVGSAPVDEPGQLFALVAEHLPGHVRRVPDGEVGERDAWIRWQYPKLAQSPQLAPALVDTGYLGRELEQFALIDEAETAVELVDLGYADAALASWEVFRAGRDAGVIGADTRFMVGLPSPLSVVTMYVAPPSRPLVFDAWSAAMADELGRIVDAIPHDDLAIQWEACIEFGILEGIWTYLDQDLSGPAARPGIAEHLVALGQSVPEAVELGYHLCYGDSGHQHFVEPSDTGHLAWAAGAVLEGMSRPVQWIHLPVPRSRHDTAYFAPLAGLDVPAATELYLGLIHHTDGADGDRRRIDAAAEVVPRFGVATECGLGRRPLDTVGPLLRQHALAAAPWPGP